MRRRRPRVIEGGRRLPQRPYRDSALLYAALAAFVVGFTVITGGSLLRGVIVAAACFVVATSWSWTHWRRRIRERERQEAVARKMRAS
jgi:hypothetical protein